MKEENFMDRQKGQAAVELALIAPLFFAICFGMIYGGMVFADYLSLNNAARETAREISLTPEQSKRDELKEDFERKVSYSEKQLTKLYAATPNVTFNTDAKNVEIKIDLTLNENNLPGILKTINFPPKKISPIEIVMPLENRTE